MFSLKRKAGGKPVTIDIKNEADSAPIADARIHLHGSIENFEATTDVTGRATITVTRSDTYTIQITHSRFESIEDSLHVKSFDDNEPGYRRAYEMAPRREARLAQLLRVSVREKNTDGTFEPLKFAAVTARGSSGVTDEDGALQILHNVPPGETITVTAVPAEQDFTQASGSVIVKATGRMMDLDELAREAARRNMDPEFQDVIQRFMRYPSQAQKLTAAFVREFDQVLGIQAVDFVSITCPANTEEVKLALTGERHSWQGQSLGQ